MVSTYTNTKNLERVGRGDQVGVWDTPENSNWTVVDSALAGVTVIALNNSPVVLSPAQYQNNVIAFNSTLTGNVAITFPSSFIGPYNISNNCTGIGSFTITLQTTVVGGLAVGVPPGAFSCTVFNDGASIYFIGGDRIGTYWDYAGSSVPNWVSACSVPPYLNCDGSGFPAGVYPQLATILGTTVLPDRRGTAGYTLNQGTARITAASGGLDGNAIFATKTTQTVVIDTSNLPAYTPSGAVAGTATNGASLLTNGIGGQNLAGGTNGFGWSNNPTVGPLTYTLNATFTGAAQGGGSVPMPAIGTGTVYGITMIRAV